MKILKHGKAQGWWVGKVGTCKNCGTEIQVEEGDKVSEQFDRNEALASVPCPECKSPIWVYPASPTSPTTNADEVTDNDSPDHIQNS